MLGVASGIGKEKLYNGGYLPSDFYWEILQEEEEEEKEGHLIRN